MQYVNFAIHKIISNIYIILYTTVNIVGCQCLLKIGTTRNALHNLRLQSKCVRRTFQWDKYKIWVGIVPGHGMWPPPVIATKLTRPTNQEINLPSFVRPHINPCNSSRQISCFLTVSFFVDFSRICSRCSFLSPDMVWLEAWQEAWQYLYITRLWRVVSLIVINYIVIWIWYPIQNISEIGWVWQCLGVSSKVLLL